MKWLKHDSDAHRDAKLKRVMIKYGMEGYGLYWYCLEQIAAGVDRHNLTFELEHDAEIIAHDTGIYRERVEEMMAYMVNLGLFENTSGVITCMKLATRLDQSMTNSPEMRKAIKDMRSSHDHVMTPSAQNRIEEKRIEKKKHRGRFTPPSVVEVREYCQARGNSVDAEAFVAFYESKGWKVGNQPMKSWKSAIVTWEKRGDGKPAEKKPHDPRDYAL